MNEKHGFATLAVNRSETNINMNRERQNIARSETSKLEENRFGFCQKVSLRGFFSLRINF